ncbi:MAG: hypothetical protein A3A94_03430 [Candidatus Portnoybacteria bacterium RIFCSPLOWO2_01_FULL_43_11]|uniref:Uncharacterized protein n=4 Tax=Bacteria candidate phyla TaxID=1783234 RepID=A0A1G2FRX0_9BACT|nr:MAG: hypothetical protein A2713_01765 [candidate division WWE3 bacterium RIFCSPHIGHO2_01_FULL_35_17]OGZ38401.1 MAG: hypothetical protein A3A94_03430 [Candidatus Portnoybacteria bacterium RIFCSPLOWO2_01_FULL_43_11]OGZ38960.1 MAG: hypothetical protein A3E90_00485 [Candidatus Portnoybacteria bacterium RIFCSPHIGHO2_12_FULL_40_11]OGZ40844.1 MAG: hypothetical protein A3I20_02465 [Candidatus Portnoybacteria bacterium RIFCSPLOWO2_02_FULL_40_15]
MRILLINPSLHQATTGQYKEDVEKGRGVYPPLGLAYIAAVLLKNNHQVKMIDYDIEGSEAEIKIENTCRDFKPQIVGFYAMTWSYGQAKRLAKKIKEIDRNIIALIGGPNATCLPEPTLEFGDFDFGILGEGEETIIELIEKLEGKNNLEFEKILGLVFKKDGQIIINPPRPLIKDLNAIPFPARHLLPIKKYFDVFSREKRFATIIATRGCPFNCVFCDRKNRMGRTWRMRSPENIEQEIKEVIDQYGIREFMFFDDNFIIDKEWAYEVCERLKKLNIIWECRERVDMVDEPILRAMKSAGCYRIRFGFESGDNRILNVLKKGITVEQSLKCAQICKKIGLEIYGYFMIGAPEETPQTIERTINLALKIEPSFAIFSKTILIPGSELFEYGVSTGQIDKDYWPRFLLGRETNGAPSLSSELLPEKLVDQYVKKADRKFYFRLKFIFKKILEVKSFKHLISQARIGFALLFK